MIVHCQLCRLVFFRITVFCLYRCSPLMGSLNSAHLSTGKLEAIVQAVAVTVLNAVTGTCRISYINSPSFLPWCTCTHFCSHLFFLCTILLSSGHSSKIEAILQMLQYAEKNDDLTAGLVVAAIGACRDLNDWQGAYQIYNTVKVQAM